MTNKTRSFQIALGLILVAFILLTSYISFTNRIENDAAFHALISREIAERQTLLTDTRHIGATENSNFPVTYPQIFHLTGAVAYLLIGEYAFIVLPIIYGTLSLIFFFIALNSINSKKVAILIALAVLAFNSYFIDFSSKYFMEIGLVFSAITAITYSIKLIETGRVQNLYLATIFYGLAISQKQQGLFVIPTYVFTLIFYFKTYKGSLKSMFLSVALIVIYALGPLGYLFYSTGSLLYPGENPPRIIQKIEQPLRSLINARLIAGDSEWSTVNEGRRSVELQRWRNINNNVTPWLDNLAATIIPWTILAGVVLILITQKVIKGKSKKDFIVLLFISSFYFLLFYLARPRYALPLIVLPSLIIFYFINYLSLSRRKEVLLTMVTFVTVIFLIELGNNISGLINRDSYGYFGKYINNRDDALQQLYKPIISDEQKNFTILSPLPYETAFYTKQKAIWANPYGGIDLFKAFLEADEQKALDLFKKYEAKYLIIYDDRYMTYTNWAGITPSNGFLSRVDLINNFVKVTENEAGRVYRIAYD